ncbi:MAG: DNA helicase RecQ [Pirellulales bacterium]
MHASKLDSRAALPSILEKVRTLWGYDRLRPLQEEAILAGVDRRDSLVVLPTGGGKSLCYQAPPLLTGRTDVVVSPLISLMKDQVDGLTAVGYPAAALYSGLPPEDRRAAERGMAEGRFRLVFVSPERLLTPGFLAWAERTKVASFAVDEAHCISQWGHDFRPEYRQLAVLRERMEHASLHAFTATATPRVRDDIVQQLKLRDPAVLVGRFDRPNLTYRVLPLVDIRQQVLEVVQRHHREAAIVYCISRRETEIMAQSLVAHGIRADHYHAGRQPDQRQAIQEAFAQERLDVVVATVAFGMGIDRSNVRCVIHASIPKSIEHYQQETGRAGRDGLEAECVLFYSGADVIRWRSLFEKSAETAEEPAAVIQGQVDLLNRMARFCSTARCRHQALSDYFGQTLETTDCGACDVCLGEVEGIEGAPIVAQKILSCVARTEQRFGVGHVVDVLSGANTDMIRRCRHHTLSTHGLLKEVPRKTLMSYVYQLIDQQVLDRTDGDRPILQLNDASWQVMRGERDVILVQTKRRGRSARRASDDFGWEGVDRGLFERLRIVRAELAHQRGVPPYIICGDRTLRDLARQRPTSIRKLHAIHGLGEKRIADFGEPLIDAIEAHGA